ncbi:hypothetical protein SDC9_207009 [bioreactor metagenome]|uniref:Uncharacterized protein n=1 Tax=bioreactor metagenome TaxID=1076179 RepID=A0A645J6K1_9ZZZZ
MSQGVLRFDAALVALEFIGIALPAQGMVDTAGRWRMAAYDSPIAFIDQALLELPAQQAGHPDIQAEEQNT